MYRLYRILTVLAVVLTVVSFAPQATPAQAGVSQTYLVLYKGQSVPSGAAASIQKAGGSLVYAYDPIGVAIASSDSSSFRANLLKDSRIEGASATGDFGVQLTDQMEVVDAPAVSQVDSWGDPLSVNQWDMVQIHVPEAQEVNAGSPNVVVGDIDTGLDYTHPDLAANVDFADSVSCVGGVPNTDPAAWNG